VYYSVVSSKLNTRYTQSTRYKILSALNVSTALLDIFLCCLICQMIYDSEITTLIENGGHLRQLHDTVSTTDSSESDGLVTSSDSDGEERDKRLHRRMNEATHRDSLKMHGIKYYECFKAASLWLNEIKVSDHDDSSDERILAQVEPYDYPLSPTSDVHLSIASIEDSDGSDDDVAINE
jgi:hypothetical protein